MANGNQVDTNEVAKKYSEKQLVVFNIGTEEFGVNINEVNSIIKMEPITKIPNSQFFIEGVINLRGKIIVVINLAKKLGLPLKDVDKDSRIIVIETNDNMVGMIVDSAREAIRLSDEQIEPAPPLITQKINSDYIDGVGIVNERLLILLDLAKVLGAGEMASVQSVQQVAETAPPPAPAPEVPVPETPVSDAAPAPEVPVPETPVSDAAPASEAPVSETPVSDAAPAPEASVPEAPVSDAAPAPIAEGFPKPVDDSQ